MRSGTYSLELAPAGAAAFRGRIQMMSGVEVIRFAIRFDSLPAADVSELAGFTLSPDGPTTGCHLALRYRAATKKFALASRARASRAARRCRRAAGT